MTCYAKGKVTNIYGNQKSAVLREEEWISRWEKRQIGFHKPTVDMDLVKNKEKFLKPNCRVFIPLCGKTVDIDFLADEGHDVVGIEFSETAIKDFFHEHSIKYKRSQHPTAPYEIFKGTDKKIAIYKGDFFGINSAILGKFDAVWDRASFESVHPSLQMKYADVMNDLVKSDGKYLLSTFNWESSFPGPPFSISQDDIDTALGRYFKSILLETFEVRENALLMRTGAKSQLIHVNLLIRK
ncbi:unnamed protein product [Clavelina lepadiformis]|uniref:thiopurine S-methyltransferase n=1 Tax=Clavelina lepadiformis TaxID=159417 RepID=A0ABP0F4J7_CLALP